MSGLGSLAAALEGMGVALARDVPLAGLTTFRVGGPAALFVEASDEGQLQAVMHRCAEGLVPMLALGRGSNVLVSDRGFPGLVVKLGRAFARIEVRDGVLVAGGAATLPQVANRAANHDLGGLEFCVAIPGSVGGGVRMNAGAHGSSVGDVLAWARVLDPSHPEPRMLEHEDLGFGYRKSSIDAVMVVVQAGFRATVADRGQIQERMAAYRDHRTATQPVDAPNAGSMFANPEGDFAGRLIEQVGAKGMFVGKAQVSEKHANFFLAHDGATAQDVYNLLARVQTMVAESAGIVMRPEVRIIGEFDEPSGWRLVQ